MPCYHFSRKQNPLSGLRISKMLNKTKIIELALDAATKSYCLSNAAPVREMSRAAKGLA